MVQEYFSFWIIFHLDQDQSEDVPISKFSSQQEMKDSHKFTMHLFSSDLEYILPALEYVMHLPRFCLDLYNLNEDSLNTFYDVSHDILIIPDSFISILNLDNSLSQPTLIIYAQDCKILRENILETFHPLIGAYEVSELNVHLLKKQWGDLFSYFKNNNYEMVPDIDKQYLLEDEILKALPILPLARQYGSVDEVLKDVFEAEDVEKECITLQCQQISHLNTLSCLQKFDFKIGNLESVYQETYDKMAKQCHINVVVTFSGISHKLKKYGAMSPTLPKEEKQAIRILGLHRAISKNGVLLELGVAGEEWFRTLNELEQHCIEGTNNRYIWKKLHDFGVMLRATMKDYQLITLLRAEHITIFSDLPIGLAIVEPAEVPLHCFKSISYRPLSPLTRSLQIEMSKKKRYSLSKKCKVIFADCILTDDETNKFVSFESDLVARELEDLKNQYPNFIFERRSTYTVKELKTFIFDNSDADVLYISAHGKYDYKRNMAGLIIGNEFWMADDDMFVPPIVILSACHSSPRGIGAVNVADMFMRMGALTVLSTLIPVNAYKNSVLMSRMFTYILEGQLGSNQYKTLADLWTGVVATNAIHEMAASSKKLELWLNSKNSFGKIRIEEFKMERSVGKLHLETVYSDTINILKEMLKEENLENKFSNILDERDFFPESFFYQLIGFPENIFICDKIFVDGI